MVVRAKITAGKNLSSEEARQAAAVVSTPAALLQAEGECNRPASGEAANLARLGNYSPVYAILAVSADAGLLAVMTAFGVPLDGDFGGVAIARMLLQLVATSALVLVLYTCVCAPDFRGNGWCRPALQFLGVGVLLVFLGLDHGDMTANTAQLLGWVGEHIDATRPFCEPGASPG